MAELPLLSASDRQAALGRVRFLESLAGREAGDPTRDALAAAHALGEAAALCMATDRTAQGRALLRNSVERILSAPTEALPAERLPLVRVALCGALTERTGIRLSPSWIELESRRGAERLPWLVARPDAAGALLAASLRYGRGRELWDLFGPASQWEPTTAGLVAVRTCPEFGLLAVFGQDRPPWAEQAAAGVMMQLLQRWLLRLSLLLADADRRALMALAGPVIDWPLLAIWLALSRIDAGFYRDALLSPRHRVAPELVALAEFLVRLAAEFGDATDQRAA